MKFHEQCHNCDHCCHKECVGEFNSECLFFITKQNEIQMLYLVFINSLEEKHWQVREHTLQFLKGS